ncbi:MAG: hypothetical protein JRF33_04425 [Deltaproteobacteria bacterium]|nr:hypothetical protein [Deltaproteobacteria bacterium]
MNTCTTKTAGHLTQGLSQALLWAIVLMFVFVACGGNNDTEQNEIATDAEIVAFCEASIAEIETSSSVDQLAGFEEITQNVADYDYSTPDAPNDPPGAYTLEPTGPAHYYKMFGVIALLNGNRSAALWASLQATIQAPSDPEFLAQVGAVLINSERCEEATTFLNKAKHIDEDHELYRMSLSVAHSCLEEKKEAIAEMEKAVELAEDNLLAKEALKDLYLEELDSATEPREAMLFTCYADIVEAIKLSSAQEASDFTMSKSTEVSELTSVFLDLFMAMPTDIPEGFLESLDAVDTEYNNRYENSFTAPLEQAVNDLSDVIASETESISQGVMDCCETNNYACSCFYNYCSDYMNLQETEVFPRTNAALQAFLPGSLVLFKDRELASLGEIVRQQEQISDTTADWASRYIYNLQAMHCKEISLEVAYALQSAFWQYERAKAECELEEMCRNAEEAARQTELQQKIDDAREAEAARLEAESLAKQTAHDADIQGELCLDSLGCLGVDGSKLTLKIGGPVFASLGVDTAKFGVEIRAGVGISDPTGNLAAADLSLGGEITSSGSSIDIKQSQSMAAGTIKSEISIFKIKSDF